MNEGHHSVLQSVVRHLEQGKATEALRLCQDILTQDSGNADALHLAGLALSRMGRFEEGVGFLQQSAAQRPNDPQVHFHLGKTLRHGGRLAEAAAAYRQAVALRPDFAEAFVNLANALSALGQPRAAEQAYRQALDLRPTSAIARNGLGAVLLEVGRLAEALEAFDRALTLKSDFPEACNNRGLALTELGRTQEADDAFRKALELRPNYAKAHLNLALITRFAPNSGDLAALEALAASPGLQPEQQTLLDFALGKALDDIGAYEKAFSHFQRANGAMAERVAFDLAPQRARLESIRSAYGAAPAIAEPPAAAEPVPVFVTGMSRSGKTLVEGLLKGHPEVAAAGERSLWAMEIDSRLESLGARHRFPEAAGSLTPDQKATLRQAYFAELAIAGPSHVVNTWPGHLDFVGLIFEVFPEARVIYCRRDALDNCLFMYFRHYASGNSYSYDLRQLGAFYRLYDGLAAFWRARYGKRILTVGYEDVVRAPEATAATLYDFCGLDFKAAQVEAAFAADEIGHSRHYDTHLSPLVEALGPSAGG